MRWITPLHPTDIVITANIGRLICNLYFIGCCLSCLKIRIWSNDSTYLFMIKTLFSFLLLKCYLYFTFSKGRAEKPRIKATGNHSLPFLKINLMSKPNPKSLKASNGFEFAA